MRIALLTICLGGAVMTASIFFRYAYGPWGSEISLWNTIYWNMSWPPNAMLITIWPAAFGAIEAVFALLAIVGRGKRGCAFHWPLTTLLLSSIGIVLLSFLWQATLADLKRLEFLLPHLLSLCALTALLVVMVAVRTNSRKSSAIRLVGAAWAVSWIGTGLLVSSDGLENVGPGFWMLLGGAVLIALGSLPLLSGPGKDGHATLA